MVSLLSLRLPQSSVTPHTAAPLVPAKALRSPNDISPQRSVWGEIDSGDDEELAPNIDLSRGSGSWGSGGPGGWVQR